MVRPVGGAARAAKLTIAAVDAAGKLTPEAVVATANGARNGVVTDEGATYLTTRPRARSSSSAPSGADGPMSGARLHVALNPTGRARYRKMSCQGLTAGR